MFDSYKKPSSQKANLIQHSITDAIAVGTAAFDGDRIDFVEKHNRRRGGARFAENVADGFLGLADILVEQLGLSAREKRRQSTSEKQVNTKEWL